MPNTQPGGAGDFRIVYWGENGTAGGGSLGLISMSSEPEEQCTLTRLPTSLDPTTDYEELAIRFPQPGPERPNLTLIGAPSDPELSSVRMQLLDRAGALVLTLDAAAHNGAHAIPALDELISALAAYGRRLDDLPLVVQFTPSNPGDREQIYDALHDLDIHPLAVHEVSDSSPASCWNALGSLFPAIRETQGPGGRALTPESSALPEASDPWETMPGSPSTALATSEISTLLEESILAEDDSLDPDFGFDLGFNRGFNLGFNDAVPGTAQGDLAKNKPGSEIRPTRKYFEIASVGTAERAGKHGVRVPLVLSATEGDSVPLTLRIELEAAPGERES